MKLRLEFYKSVMLNLQVLPPSQQLDHLKGFLGSVMDLQKTERISFWIEAWDLESVNALFEKLGWQVHKGEDLMIQDTYRVVSCGIKDWQDSCS